MIPRPAAAVLLACLLASCGRSEPVWKQRTAEDWAAQLWSASPRDAEDAYDALVGLGEVHPDAVLAAIEAGMRRPPPAPIGSPFTVTLDAEAAAALGLSDVAPPEAVANVLPVVRARVAALGLVPTSIKADVTGDIDLVAPGGRRRADIEHAQAILCTRGALDVRAVVRAPGSGGGGVVYDGATPWPDFLAAEGRLVAAARAARAPYRPSDPRWRLVVPPPPAEPVVLEEPRTPAEAIDERIVQSAEGLLARDGTPAVRIEVRADRREDVARFLRRHAGGDLVVLADGALRARQPVPAAEGTELVLSAGPAPAGGEPLAWARDHALLWTSGRMPRPLKPVPIAKEFLSDPRPDNGFARVALALGEAARPMLLRLQADGPSWARASAAWVLSQPAPTGD
jgi:hypothetical protein